MVTAENAEAAPEAFVEPEGIEFIGIQELDGFLIFGGDSGGNLLFFLAFPEDRHALAEAVIVSGTAGGQLDHIGQLEAGEGGKI